MKALRNIKSAEDLSRENLEMKETAARIERNRLLDLTDYIMMDDYPINDKAEWRIYRQALRDMPGESWWPNDPVWPVAPGLPSVAFDA